MEVRKAVITAAGRGVRLFPAADTVQKAMLPLIDRDGLPKPAIQIIAEEALSSGIEEICVICAPGDEAQYLNQFRALRENLMEGYHGIDWAALQAARIDELLQRLHFAVQTEPFGFGHAVHCAKDFVGDQAMLLMLSDHVYISTLPGKSCAAQLVDLARKEACSVSAVSPTREHLVGRYGTLTGKRVHDQPGLYQVEKIIEKPSISQAELELLTPGLRAGHYLCIFGMNVLTPRIFELLEESLSGGDKRNGGYQLTPCMSELAQREKYLALEVQGRRVDIGARLGLLRAQVALGLAGDERHEVLAAVTEMLVEDAATCTGKPGEGS